jgi:hypothetical protein
MTIMKLADMWRLTFFINIFIVKLVDSTRYIVTCTRDEMTGSSSDDWILLALWLQPFLITLTYNAIAIPHTLQSLSTLVHIVYFQQSSLQHFISNCLLLKHWTALPESLHITSSIWLPISLHGLTPPAYDWLWTHSHTDWPHKSLTNLLL